MDNPLHDIDKLFKNSLDPLEQTPSLKVWDQINEHLDEKQQKKPLPVLFWLKRTLLVLLLSGCTFGGYLLFQKRKPATQQFQILLKNK